MTNEQEKAISQQIRTKEAEFDALMQSEPVDTLAAQQLINELNELDRQAESAGLRPRGMGWVMEGAE